MKRAQNDKEGDKKKGNKPFEKKPYKKKHYYKNKSELKRNPIKPADGLVRLNKFLANAGICSRREADTLIQSGVVSVNGKVVTELGTKIKETDKISYGGETIKSEKKVYVLMNKPKDFMTKLNDPFGRRTVLQLLGKLKQRVTPVGQLERSSTGVLMLTNDEDLTQRLTHPGNGVRKIVHVALNKKMTAADLQKLTEGVELNDGKAKVDNASFVNNGKDKRQIGIEFSSNKNLLVKRMLEQLGYEIIKLDQVYFAGLTKKNLSRGQWRFLTEKEVNLLKMSSSVEKTT